MSSGPRMQPAASLTQSASVLPIARIRSERTMPFRRARFLSLLPAAALLLLVAAAPLGAFQSLTVISGQFTSFTASSGLLAVNTRVGPRSLRVVAGTLVFLNSRTAGTGDLVANDTITVRYRFDTLEVARIDISREAKQRGTVGAVAATTFELKFRRGQLALRLDTLSRINLDGIPLTNRTVLTNTGLPATVVYEPRGLIILGANATGTLASGVISTITTGTRTVVVQTRTRAETIVLDANATILRNGNVAVIADLVVGDRVRCSFLRGTTTNRGLAIESQR